MEEVEPVQEEASVEKEPISGQEENVESVPQEQEDMVEPEDDVKYTTQILTDMKRVDLLQICEQKKLINWNKKNLKLSRKQEIIDCLVDHFEITE